MSRSAKRIPQRILAVLVFSLFFSWLLALPFEGKILYALAEAYGLSAGSLVFGALGVHLAGLFFCGFLIRSMVQAKRLMLGSIVFCMITTIVFMFDPSPLWQITLLAASFLCGGSVAAWGWFLKYCTYKEERVKTIADGLIFSNLLMILLDAAALFLAPRIGLALSMLLLSGAFYFALQLPAEEDTAPLKKPNSMAEDFPSIIKPLTFLCIFIIIITINSGLMYQVQGPAFSHLGWLTGWYWAVPYITALTIMRNLPKKINKAYILFTAIGMMGFSFIFFSIMDRSVLSYLVVNTLMLGACGVFDLFWWSILGDMLDYSGNPARILGVGLSSNITGILLGKGVGYFLGSGPDSSLLALAVVCLCLVMLPVLYKYLSESLKEHVFGTMIMQIPVEAKRAVMVDFIQMDELSVREKQLAQLIMKGMTYKEMASTLAISENTVKTHIKNIYYKCKVNNRSELITKLLEDKKK